MLITLSISEKKSYHFRTLVCKYKSFDAIKNTYQLVHARTVTREISSGTYIIQLPLSVVVSISGIRDFQFMMELKILLVP